MQVPLTMDQKTIDTKQRMWLSRNIPENKSRIYCSTHENHENPTLSNKYYILTIMHQVVRNQLYGLVQHARSCHLTQMHQICYYNPARLTSKCRTYSSTGWKTFRSNRNNFCRMSFLTQPIQIWAWTTQVRVEYITSKCHHCCFLMSSRYTQ